MLNSSQELKMGDAVVPKEFRIFREGVNHTTKGPLLFDKIAAHLVMMEFKVHGIDLFIDADHSVLEPSGPPTKGKAFGWFTPEVRNGELWATNLQWTNEGAQLLSERAYRFFSPVVFTEFEPDEKTGARRIKSLLNVALTNIPAMRRLDPIVADRLFAANRLYAHTGTEKGTTMIVKLAEISDDAAESMSSALAMLLELLASEASAEDKIEGSLEGIAAVAAMLEAALAEDDEESDDDDASDDAGDDDADDSDEDELEEDEEELEEDEDLSRLLCMLNAGTVNEAEMIIDAINTLSTRPASEVDQVLIEMIAKNVESTDRISQLVEMIEVKEKKENVAELIKLGKLIPAQEAWALSVDVATLESFAKDAPVIAVGERITQAKKREAKEVELNELSPEEIRFMRKMGLDTDDKKKAFLKNKLAQAQTSIEKL